RGRHPPRLLGLHVDAAAEARAVLQDHTRRGDVAANGAGLAQDGLLGGVDVAVHLSFHHHHLAEEVRAHAPALAHRDVVLLEIHLALDAPFDDQVLLAREVTLDEDRGTDGGTLDAPRGVARRGCEWARGKGGWFGMREFVVFLPHHEHAPSCGTL